jgi:hypothetical protein
MGKRAASYGYMLEIQEGSGNNWETHNFPSFCELLDFFDEEVMKALDPALRQSAMRQYAKGTKFWELGTSVFDSSGYTIITGNVRYFFSYSTAI